MQLRKLLPSLVLFSLLVSCNSNKEKKADDNKSATTEVTDNKTPITSGKFTSDISLAIKGGDMEGNYTATCNEGCCSWGVAGENVFGNQYSVTGKGAKELSSVQLIVNDVKQGNKTTGEFTLTVSFGELFGKDSKTYNINTRQGYSEGSGTVTVQYEGEKATVTVKGVSKEGPEIDLKMECHKVINAENMAEYIQSQSKGQ